MFAASIMQLRCTRGIHTGEPTNLGGGVINLAGNFMREIARWIIKQLLVVAAALWFSRDALGENEKK